MGKIILFLKVRN